MSHKAWTAGLLGVLVWTSMARAQVPGVPPGAAAGLGGLGGAAGPAAAGVPAAAAAPRTVWGMFGITHDNIAACKLKICRSPLGPMLSSMTAGPLGAVSGGLLTNCCPPPTAAEIAALEAKGGPQGAAAVAAKIQADEADAKARVAAVEYLGTVDCRYWKEAQVALLNALRADRNECVRYAAARAFNNGCCCSKEVIETLRIVVAGEDSDGFPAESSTRIRGTAFAALQNCLMKVQMNNLPPEPLEPEKGPAATPTTAPAIQPERAAALPPLPGSADPSHLAASHVAALPLLSPVPAAGQPASAARPLSIFEARVRNKTFAGTVDEARRTLFVLSQTTPKVVTPGLPPGKQSVFHAVTKARQDLADASRAKTEAAHMNAPATMPEMSTTTAAPAQARQPVAGPTRAKEKARATYPAPDAPVVPASYWGPKAANVDMKKTSEPAAKSPVRRVLTRLIPLGS